MPIKSSSIKSGSLKVPGSSKSVASIAIMEPSNNHIDNINKIIFPKLMWHTKKYE